MTMSAANAPIGLSKYKTEGRSSTRIAKDLRVVDPVLAAGIAMLDLARQLLHGPLGELTLVFHVDAAFHLILGRSRPTYALFGPAMRVAMSILNAAPPASHCVTEAFHQRLAAGRVDTPRFEGDVFVDVSSQRWCLRGVGVVRVRLLRCSSPLCTSTDRSTIASPAASSVAELSNSGIS